MCIPDTKPFKACVSLTKKNILIVYLLFLQLQQNYESLLKMFCR